MTGTPSQDAGGDGTRDDRHTDDGTGDERRTDGGTGDDRHTNDGADGDRRRPDRPPVADEWDAIFWDVGGVILDIDSVQEAHRRFVGRLIDEHDLAIDLETALERWRTTVGDHFHEREGTEFTSARAGYAKAIEAIAGDPLPTDEWLPTFRETVADSLETNPGAVEAIEELAAMDLHLGVCSDADRDELLFILEEFDVLASFDSLTISEDVGRTKPDPAMFEAALAAADADPERSIMIGDRYEHDMAGATEFGMTTVSHGAADGDAVDYMVREDLTELLEILRGDRE